MTDLVEIAFVGNEYEAVIIQTLLEESGIPSLQEQVGADGSKLGYPWLGPGGGQRRVMVHAHRAEEASALLAEAEASDETPPEPESAI